MYEKHRVQYTIGNNQASHISHISVDVLHRLIHFALLLVAPPAAAATRRIGCCHYATVLIQRFLQPRHLRRIFEGEKRFRCCHDIAAREIP